MVLKIVVIGAGPGGYVAAVRAAQLGADVTIVEKHAVGGCCLNHGCIPSKIFQTTADILTQFHHAREYGIECNAQALPLMESILKRKQKIIKAQADGILSLLKQHKITILNGEALIQAPKLIHVKQENNTEIEVEWDRLILALGSLPLEIPAFPFDGQNIISSNEALELKQVPESILIVGGGVVGCEFACIMNALGSNVTIVEAQNRLLPLDTLDESCSKILHREMKKRKIAVHVNKTIEKIEQNNTTQTAVISSAGEDPITVAVEKVLVCIGRKPDTTGVGLETLGIKQDPKGWIIANHKMETNIPNVYAIGDLLGPSKIMLAHVASKEGLIAAENAMGLNKSMNYNAVPGAIFTKPEIAHVGITEKHAKDRGLDVRAETTLFRTLGKAHVLGEIEGQAKMISLKENGKVLGIHLIGPHVTDLVSEGTLAINTGATVFDIAETIHPHPTLSEIIGELSHKMVSLPLDGH